VCIIQPLEHLRAWFNTANGNGSDNFQPVMQWHACMVSLSKPNWDDSLTLQYATGRSQTALHCHCIVELHL